VQRPPRFSPTNDDTGSDGLELMIWIDYADVGPIGSRQDTVTIGGITWDVYTGRADGHGFDTISYLATDADKTRSVLDLPLNTFFDDALARDMLQPDWWLTTIQAGFEPWSKGAGLATVDFSVTGVTT